MSSIKLNYKNFKDQDYYHDFFLFYSICTEFKLSNPISIFSVGKPSNSFCHPGICFFCYSNRLAIKVQQICRVLTLEITLSKNLLKLKWECGALLRSIYFQIPSIVKDKYLSSPRGVEAKSLCNYKTQTIENKQKPDDTIWHSIMSNMPLNIFPHMQTMRASEQCTTNALNKVVHSNNPLWADVTYLTWHIVKNKQYPKSLIIYITFKNSAYMWLLFSNCCLNLFHWDPKYLPNFVVIS